MSKPGFNGTALDTIHLLAKEVGLSEGAVLDAVLQLNRFNEPSGAGLSADVKRTALALLGSVRHRTVDGRICARAWLAEHALPAHNDNGPKLDRMFAEARSIAERTIRTIIDAVGRGERPSF